MWTFLAIFKIYLENKLYFEESLYFCSPFIWGDGYERIRVIGRAKDTNKFISLIMEAKWIESWRIQKVYIPYILRRNSLEMDRWDKSDSSKQIILEMLEWLPERSLKIYEGQ